MKHNRFNHKKNNSFPHESLRESEKHSISIETSLSRNGARAINDIDVQV